MQPAEGPIPPGNKVLQLALPLDAQQKLGVLVVPQLALGRGDTNAGDVDVPTVDVVPLGCVVQDTGVNGVAVDDLDLGEADALLEAGRGGDAGDHHQLDELPGLDGQLPPLRLLQAVLGGGDLLSRKRFEKLVTGKECQRPSPSTVTPVWLGGGTAGNVPPGAYPARTPSPGLYPGRGSRGYVSQRCISGWEVRIHGGGPRHGRT